MKKLLLFPLQAPCKQLLKIWKSRPPFFPCVIDDGVRSTAFNAMQRLVRGIDLQRAVLSVRLHEYLRSQTYQESGKRNIRSAARGWSRGAHESAARRDRATQESKRDVLCTCLAGAAVHSTYRV